MKIEFNLNGKPCRIQAPAGENVQKLLQHLGIPSVRNSDDASGITGSDAIRLDKKIVNAGLLVAAQLEGRAVETVESLSDGRTLSAVQSALVDTGTVQSGYNAPAVALMLTDLLERIPEPTAADVVDALSGFYTRDNGYQQYFRAVELAKERCRNSVSVRPVAEEFREDLRDVGKTRRKVDGPQLVLGQKAFVEDRVEPGSCVLKMLRSPHAHAYIRMIDASEAERIPGVVLILTHQNSPDVYYTQAGQNFPEPSPYDRKMFNQKLRHVGDRVAAVVAETEEIACRALKKIKVTYEVLKPVLSIAEAAVAAAPRVQNGLLEFRVKAPENLEALNRTADPRDGKILYPFPIGADPRRNIAASAAGGIGDVEKGFREGDVVIEREYQTAQVQQTPCETHTVYTRMEGGRLIIHASTQVPWHLRRIVARVLGIGENQIRVIKERVGGAYGSKQDILLEEVCAYATWKTGRSIFCRFSREEEFTATSSRHPMTIRVKLGAKSDGRLTAVQMNVRANTGPFANHGLTVPMNACSKSLPLFLCENMQFEVTSYYSNIFPTGAYQGYGAPQGSFALQTALAELAAELHMDGLKLIEKNRVRAGARLEILRCLGEGRQGAAVVIKSCGLDQALAAGAALMSRERQEKGQNSDVRIGRSVVIVQQGSGLPGLDQANAAITLQSDGSFIIHSGGTDLGTGLDTLCVKMASETLCTDMGRISIISADTDHTPFDTGAYASSGTFFSGNAALLAARDLKIRVLAAAAQMLHEPAEKLQLLYPDRVRGGGRTLTFAEIARHRERGNGPGPLTGRGCFTTEETAFPYGAHFCEVGVNIRTGEIKVRKYYALQDCGTPINPELAEGQVYGGVLKAIGHSLWEELQMDAEGRCLNANLRDYGGPTIGDLPGDLRVKLIATADPFGPFGAKSVSELSCNGAAPAIAIAIHDAVGLWLRAWPFTPEKILAGLNKIPDWELKS